MVNGLITRAEYPHYAATISTLINAMYMLSNAEAKENSIKSRAEAQGYDWLIC